jgi:hypothetical protein
MKLLPWLAIAPVTLALVMAACGDDRRRKSHGDDDGGGGEGPGPGSGPGSGPGGSTGPTSGTGGNPSTSSSTSGTGGSGLNGSGICGSDLSIDGAVYDGCLDEACCGSFVPCVEDAGCSPCLSDPMAPGCANDPLFQAFQACFDGSCAAAVCTSMLAYPSPHLNSCINTHCCPQFNACEPNATCNTCLMDPMAPGCAQSVLFTNYNTCKDANCPSDICGTGILFVVTYANQSQDQDIAGTLCAQQNCCADLTDCADPSMDGHLDMNDPEVDACVACLGGDPSCVGGSVLAAANAFNACFAAACP